MNIAQKNIDVHIKYTIYRHLILHFIFDILIVYLNVNFLNLLYNLEVYMKSCDVIITNASGLHARPATFFIQKANSYKSTIMVEKDGRKVNAKSLLGVLSLGIAKGMTITLIAEGYDEEAAVNGLAALVNAGFNE